MNSNPHDPVDEPLPEPETVSWRRLSATQRESLRKLLDTQGWDYAPADLERLARLNGGRDPVLVGSSGDPVAYLTALPQPPLGLIGNVVVDPAWRGRGLARRLLERALSDLEGDHCPTQRLFAYPHTAGLYHRLGFEAVGVTTTLELALEAFPAPEGPRTYSPDLRAELLELDRAQTGYDRSRLLEVLLAEFGDQAWVSLDATGGLDGYLLVSGRPGGRTRVSYELGPWVVTRGCRRWRSLLEAGLARLTPGEHLELSVIADRQRVLRLLHQLGFTPRHTTLDMVRGVSLELSEQNVLGRAGLVKG